ncbi:MAG: LPS export ABC transporter periplasmic protein LptC [Desulfobacteraceae bacterium]|jgi:LPS export ABC transporter protein LptC
MPIRGYPSNKILRFVLAFILILAVGGPIALFVTYRQIKDNPQKVVEIIQNEADMVFKNVEQTATRNGINEWKLSAKAAYLIESEKKMILEKPKVEFFMENGNNIFLKAQQGIYKLDSQNIQVSGDVVVTQNNYILKTKRLMYLHDKRRLLAKNPVKITGIQFDLTAGAMNVDLNQSQGLFNNGVTGKFHEVRPF